MCVCELGGAECGVTRTSHAAPLAHTTVPSSCGLLLTWGVPPSLQIDEVFKLSENYEGLITYALVQEDVGNNFDVRAWLARPRVSGRDGPPKAPDSGGIFSRLTPNCQYRLNVNGTRKAESTALDVSTASVRGGLGSLKLCEDVAVAIEEKSSCSCLFGNPCVSEYLCKDWANRIEVAKRNGYRGW